MSHILVVEDESAIAELISINLRHAGFEVTIAATAEQAQAAVDGVLPDLIILDWMLPGQSGLALAKRWRGEARTRELPVIMLTARADEADKIAGLDAGADDYLTKPFSPRELLARIQAMLRRPRASTTSAQPPAEAPPRVFGGLSIDVAGREVRCDGVEVTLTRTEFDVLEALSARPSLVYSRRQLIDAVWDQTWVGDEHLVDVHVGHLRRKLGDDPSSPRYVRTVRGIGYRMGEGR